MMLSYYDGWKGIDPRLIDRIGMGDPEITSHLKKDKFSSVMSVSIENFPNEAGYFMLWQLSVSDDEADQKILPIFVNEAGILRGMAGSKIMDVFLDPNSRLSVRMTGNISAEEQVSILVLYSRCLFL